MTIVKLSDMLSFMDVESDDEKTTLIESLTGEVERFISSYCRRTFESTQYTKERYSGRGYSIINLNQYPVTYVDRVCVGTVNVMTITNTNSGSYATVSVTPTGLRLNLDGTADSSVIFATYTTLSTVISAVNALGNGWSAEILDSTYSSFKSTELVTQYSSGCIDGTKVYLSIPDEAEDEIGVDLERGQIRLYGGFSAGFRNIFVDYTAGYSESDMPYDLKLAVKIIVQYLYEKAEDDLFGVDFYNLGASGATGLRTVFEKVPIPKEAEHILSLYKRRLL